MNPKAKALQVAKKTPKPVLPQKEIMRRTLEKNQRLDKYSNGVGVGY